MTLNPTQPTLSVAKQPLTVVAGPYGHPFHPFLVTIPIGAWVSSFVLDIATRVSSGGSRSLTDASYWLIVIGIIGALVAAVFGLLDLLTTPSGSKARRVALTHMALNLTVVVLYVVNAVWRHGNHHAPQVRVGQLVLSLVALLLLTASGWLGGRLTYRYGVRVADEVTQAEGYR
jgi:uncharacterized membrane protein